MRNEINYSCWFCPKSGTESEWAEARSRVDAYLSAWSVSDPEGRQRVAFAILRRAAMKHARKPAEKPTTVAMNESYRFLEEWFANARRRPNRFESSSAAGLVSLLAIDALEKSPGALLAEMPPSALGKAFCEHELRAAPNLQVSRMVPQPFESPLCALVPPTALEPLTGRWSPSPWARIAGFILSGLAIWTGNRLR